jgi:hypothetical protein
MFLSKDATYYENANNVFLRFVSKCEMWSKNAISDFLFCRKYFCKFVLVIMLDHFIVYVLIVRLEFFRDDERSLIRFFEVTEFWRDDSSNLTKATHQTWQTTSRQVWWAVSYQIWWEAFHQIWCAISHQTWRMISHQTWRVIFHQTWRVIFHQIW